MSADYIQAYGEGLVSGTAGYPSKFALNPNGQAMQGITFAVEGSNGLTLKKISLVQLNYFNSGDFGLKKTNSWFYRTISANFCV